MVYARSRGNGDEEDAELWRGSCSGWRRGKEDREGALAVRSLLKKRRNRREGLAYDNKWHWKEVQYLSSAEGGSLEDCARAKLSVVGSLQRVKRNATAVHRAGAVVLQFPANIFQVSKMRCDFYIIFKLVELPLRHFHACATRERSFIESVNYGNEATNGALEYLIALTQSLGTVQCAKVREGFNGPKAPHSKLCPRTQERIAFSTAGLVKIFGVTPLPRILAVACAAFKGVTDTEGYRLQIILRKLSEEWPLLNSITRDEHGSAFADVTYGGYVIICTGLLVGQLTEELRYPVMESFFLGIGVLFYSILGGLELASIELLRPELVDNAGILGGLSLLMALVFIFDIITGSKRRKHQQLKVEHYWKGVTKPTMHVSTSTRGTQTDSDMEDEDEIISIASFPPPPTSLDVTTKLPR
ncbi:hypothetical protein J437_LFUL001246 [Ladona fulva]|uniref:Uncharacterized protein n=1 Tax=Ladona fulva TaxID=123851 RepID=A0A8K0NVJ4_LADFU|nr:hypothetical protein J437_LFUL001246 [Ladona fulva]